MAARSPDRKKFDGEAFYAALDSARTARDLKWKDVAKDAGVSASTLTRMAQGKRPDVDSLAALCRWADLNADEFMRPRAEDGEERSDAPPLAMISTYLRSDPNLSAKSADMLDEVIKATYRQLRET
jgi:transcriptional regulator with XRE-family HTH domain